MPSYIAAPAADHGDSVQQQAQANHMEEVERADHGCIRLEEFPDEALQRIPADHEVKAVPEPEAVAGDEALDQYDEHRGHGDRFVELHRMARDAVAEIDAPRHGRGRAVGEVGEA